MKTSTGNRNSDQKKQAILTELISHVAFLIWAILLNIVNMIKRITSKDGSSCQQSYRPRMMFVAGAMPQYDSMYSTSRRVSPKFQPTERPRKEAKRKLGQVKKSPKRKQTLPRPMEANTWSGQLTANPTVPTHMNKRSCSDIAAGSQNKSSSFQDSFAGTIVAFLVLGTTIALAWLLFSRIRAAYTKTWNKKPGGYERLNDTEQQELVVGELSDVGSNVDCLTTRNSSDQVTTGNLEHIKLSEIPPDLEDLLVKKLDVRCEGERLYGWQKVGAAFKIAYDDLRYLKIEYKRDEGSPTCKLLKILGISQGKTVFDLVDVLKSPKVNLPDVAALII